MKNQFLNSLIKTFSAVWKKIKISYRKSHLSEWQEEYNENEKRIFRLSQEMGIMKDVLRISEEDGAYDAGWEYEVNRISIRRAVIVLDQTILKRLNRKKKKLERLLGEDKEDFDPTWYWVKER